MKKKIVNDEKLQVIFLPEIVEAVKKDYEYLQKMKEMDMKIEEEEAKGEGKERRKIKGLEMTDVVPVGGLIMARFLFLFFVLFCSLFFFFNESFFFFKISYGRS